MRYQPVIRRFFQRKKAKSHRVVAFKGGGAQAVPGTTSSAIGSLLISRKPSAELSLSGWVRQ